MSKASIGTIYWKYFSTEKLTRTAEVLENSNTKVEC